jgi:nucleotide-binding universal stress UspA family protein
MSKHITVGYDSSSASSDAVTWAADEAVARSVDLRVVSCYEVPYMGDVAIGFPAGGALEVLADAAESGLRKIRDQLTARYPALDVTTSAELGPAASILMNGLGADDLLVVGASSHHGAAAFWLGSTPRAVARRSPCPVVVARGTAGGGRPDRVVVGVDGSPESDDAVRWAIDEADLHQVELVVVHAWEYPYVKDDADDNQARDLMRVDAACVLDDSIRLARGRGAADVSDVLVEGSPAVALLGEVHDGDLLVLGSRGRGAVVAGLFGSTVNSVLERAEVPVVVVRHRAA